MNKQTIFGLIIISIIFVAYMIITNHMRKNEEAERIKNNIVANTNTNNETKINQDTYQEKTTTINQDSLNYLKAQEKYAIFNVSEDTCDKFFVVENNKMRITFTNKGAKIYSVELREYKTYDSLPLILFENGEDSEFGLDFYASGKALSTNNLYFSSNNKENTIIDAKNDTVIFSMKLNVSDEKYLEYQYIIPPDDYLIGFNINFVGLEQELENTNDVLLTWNSNVAALEKGRKWEGDNTMVTICLSDDDIEEVKKECDKDGEPSFITAGNVSWIAYKQQFFSSILVSKNRKFNSPVVKIHNIADEKSKILKRFESNLSFDIEHNKKESHEFSYYFGPNKFSILKEYEDNEGKGLKFEKLVPLGWGIFGWVNRFIVIPIFNWLGSFIESYGIIILLLTIIIKLILFPFTYKSYLSTAKMKVLKPEIDEITKRFKPEQKMEAQQATMAYYKKAGVSPMGGCLPMLLQFPILIAMFRFFPASIELRQQSFLWADDLSAYDSILQLPFTIPFYGDHISLFALLMALSMVFSTLLTQSQQPNNNAMPGMKVMMYLMPVMMLVWFNNYSAGLSYYYLLANIITILQTIIIRKFFVDEKKLKAKIEANAQKVKPKSRWQQKMEEIMKEQQKKQQQLKKR